MKIEEIIIQNFRSISHQTIDVGKYNIILGENNAGKSNIINAIRYFYDEIKIEPSDFFQKRNLEDGDMFVEILFDLSEDEKSLDYFKNQKGSKYLLSGNKIRVRKTTPINKAGAVGAGERRGLLQESQQFDADNKFFGLTGVSKSMLGDIIYIPPLKDLNDEIKATASSTMMKILKKIIHPKIKEDDGLRKINENITSFNNSDLFQEIEQDLSSLMRGYECSVKLQFNPVDVDSIISSTTVNLIEEHLEKMPSKMKGTGIQRALLINLLKY